MPYSIRKSKGSKPFKIVKTSTGKVVGSSRSKKAAVAFIRARNAGAHGK